MPGSPKQWLRIAFIGQKGLPAKWGGIEEHVDAIAIRLVQRGHHVSSYVRNWYTGDEQRDYRGVRLIKRFTIKKKPLDAGVHSLVSSLDALFRNYDIVHYHGIGPALFCGLPRIAGKKVVTTVHRLDYMSSSWNRVSRSFLKLGMKNAVRFSHHLIVVSKYLQDWYARMGITTEYLPSGVEIPEIKETDAHINAAFSLENRSYILSLGRWTPDKQIRELIDAFLSDDFGGIKLVVAGDSDHNLKYRNLVLDGGNDPRIIFTGFVQGKLKSELFQNALCHVSPSIHEGLPISILEAMSYGLPCIASDIPAHREILENGELGALFDVGDFRSMVLQLHSVIDNSYENHQETADKCIHKVRHQYNWENIVDRLEELYRKINPDKGDPG